MSYFYWFIHFAVCFVIIVGVVLSSSKSDGVSGTMGSNVSNLLGAKAAADLLTRLVTYLGIIFFASCILLNKVVIQQKSNYAEIPANK